MPTGRPPSGLALEALRPLSSLASCQALGSPSSPFLCIQPLLATTPCTRGEKAGPGVAPWEPGEGCAHQPQDWQAGMLA